MSKREPSSGGNGDSERHWVTLVDVFSLNSSRVFKLS
jgi:hypothetical protein